MFFCVVFVVGIFVLFWGGGIIVWFGLLWIVSLCVVVIVVSMVFVVFGIIVGLFVVGFVFGFVFGLEMLVSVVLLVCFVMFGWCVFVFLVC